MIIIQSDKESGVKVPPPFEREIKLLLGPDKGEVEEIRANLVILPKDGKTNYHMHDRPELIYVLDGLGICISEAGDISISKNTLIWAKKNDMHQIKNSSNKELKLFTLFVPGFNTEKAQYLEQMNQHVDL